MSAISRLLKRDELGFPTFWPMQIGGWLAFYVLILLSIVPMLDKKGIVTENNEFVFGMFAASCLLRPICRSLYVRTSSWFSLEIRASGVALLAGVADGYLIEAWGMRDWSPPWSHVLDGTVQCSLTLFLWCTLYFSIKQWQQGARERQRLLRMEAEAREARLSALRYQLNPHLLFNALNAVSTLVLDGNAAAATRMLSQIGELLRTILDGEAVAETRLSKEIDFTKQYLAIEQIRLGERLRVSLSIAPETLDALVPSMLLQPLVENAVRHGVAPMVAGGTIRISSERRAELLHMEVSNSGPRIDAEGLEGGRGIGLGNTVERLKTLYASNHRFTLQWPEAGGCEISIDLPYRRAPREQEVGA